MKTPVFRLAVGAFVAALIGGCVHKPYGDPELPVAGKVLGTVVHTRDADELRDVVLQRLTERYAQEQGIVVTAAENDTYIWHAREGLAKDRAQKVARRAELAGKLAIGGMSETERARLAAEVAALDDILPALNDPGNSTSDPQDERARQQVAAAFILQWKINRTLYQQYGGRVTYQQSGPEQLDAYLRFLEDAQSRGDFTIVNKDLEAGFWRYYVTDAIHSFYPSGSREEAAAFETPWWLAK